jgi:hypothetical protein
VTVTAVTGASGAPAQSWREPQEAMMAGPETFEALMLLCFSISWYWSIAKMLKHRVASGKSAFFVTLICVGYIAGVASKTLDWRRSGDLDPLVWLYVWNLCVTLVDLALVLHFSRKAERAALERSRASLRGVPTR